MTIDKKKIFSALTSATFKLLIRLMKARAKFSSAFRNHVFIIYCLVTHFELKTIRKKKEERRIQNRSESLS